MKPWENSQCTTNLSPWGGYSSWRPLDNIFGHNFAQSVAKAKEFSFSSSSRDPSLMAPRNFGVWCFLASKKNHLNLWTKTHDELRKYLKISMSWSWRLKLLRLEILVVLALAKKRGLGLKKMISFIAFTIFSVIMKHKIFYATWPREGVKEQTQKKNTCDSTWFCFFGFSLLPVYTLYILIHHQKIKLMTSFLKGFFLSP